MILRSLILAPVLMFQSVDMPDTQESLAHMNEVAWSAKIAKEIGGQAEVRTPDGSRVDILTDEYAYEVEWAHKPFEAVGQAVYYGLAFNRKPAVILLMRPDQEKYYLRCLVLCAELDVHLETRKVPAR